MFGSDEIEGKQILKADSAASKLKESTYQLMKFAVNGVR